MDEITLSEVNIGVNSKSKGKNLINCDQVSWLLGIADRYLPEEGYPRVSQKRTMLKYAMLYEIMETAGLEFLDDSARANATPDRVRNNT